MFDENRYLNHHFPKRTKYIYSVCAFLQQNMKYTPPPRRPREILHSPSYCFIAKWCKLAFMHFIFWQKHHLHWPRPIAMVLPKYILFLHFRFSPTWIEPLPLKARLLLTPFITFSQIRVSPFYFLRFSFFFIFFISHHL